MPEIGSRKTREKAFVDYVIALAQKDTGYAAKMRRADNRVTEDYAWEFLAPWINLQNDNERLPYALIGAAICREKPAHDGDSGIGQELAKRCKDIKDQGSSRLRRLLSCDSVPEACRILRQMIKFLQAQETGKISYARLLGELIDFGHEKSERVKQTWAMDFYNNLDTSTSKDTDK